MGPDLADASVNANATMLELATGLGGTIVSHATFHSSGLTNGFTLKGGGTTGALAINNSVGVNLSWNSISTLLLDSGKFRLSNASLTLDSASNSQVVCASKPLYIYATGSSGITETIRLVNNRADAGLKSVVVGTENATPNATSVLFQVAHSITTAATDAGNGTGLFKVYGAGNVSIPTGAAIYFGGNIATGCYVYGSSTTQLELGCNNSTAFTLTAAKGVLVGAMQIGTAGAARPTADATSRGLLWYSKSAGGAADTLEVCLKSAADTYSWKVIQTG
jgi:hypothetical protein